MLPSPKRFRGFDPILLLAISVAIGVALTLL